RNTGMLVVTEVLPGSPSENVLQPGDILVRLNGRYVTQFEPLEDVLDGSVAKQVEVELERGGKAVSAKLPVGDLHAITPSSYAEFGDAVGYMTIDDPNTSELRAIRMDRLWFPARHCDRDDASGLWDCQPLAAGPQPKPVPESSTVFPHFKDPRLNALAPSLAMVTFDM